MIYRWSTKTPTRPGQYWAMMGGCRPVSVSVEHMFEPHCEEDLNTANNPLCCSWHGQVGEPVILSDSVAICWCHDPEPPIPRKYWLEWRSKKPVTVETAEIARGEEF